MVPSLRAHSEGRNVLLMFEADVGASVKIACDQHMESDAGILAKVSEIVRRDMFRMKYSFSRSLTEKCQDEAVPGKLKALVNMILEGPAYKTKPRMTTSPRDSQFLN